VTSDRDPWDDAPPPAGPQWAAVEPEDGLALPNSVDAEREVLASILVDPTCYDAAAALLTPADFHSQAHAAIFTAMAATHARAGTVDPMLLAQALKDAGQWEKVGGLATLSGLLDRIGTTAHLPHYCAIVRSKALLRRVILAARDIEVEGHQAADDPDAFVAMAERRILAAVEDRQAGGLRPVTDVIRESVDQISAAFEADGEVTGLPSGFRDLDALTSGLHGGDLLILAARPAMGKTAFALNLAANAAVHAGATVALYSLEMPAAQLVTRMLASEARLDMSRIRAGKMAEDDWPRLTNAANVLSQTQIHIDDTPGATPAQIRAGCKRLARTNGLGLVIVDYLQLMAGGIKTGSREQEISHISRSLKGLAKELGCPVIALSQLNRGVESRTDKRPMMSDLRESGAIEQDADIIAFLYREEVYRKDETPEGLRGVAELIVAKHRNGPTGTVRLRFIGSQTRFDSLSYPP
jgi:replicative DNA helicase